MKRLSFSVALVISFISLYFLNTRTILADSDFETSSNIEYKFQEDGRAYVTNTITIKNKSSNLYAKSYSITLNSLRPENIKAYEKGIPINFTKEETNDSTKITLSFSEPAAGIDKTKKFVVTYEDSTLAVKSGEVWEVIIPKLSDKDYFDDYLVEVSVPEDFQEEAYIFPEPSEIRKSDGRLSYLFVGDKAKNGISAGFGESQVFSFNISYHLENPLRTNSEISIALPPDTTIQRMFYEKIEPKPDRLEIDEDYNWLAIYKLNPRQRIDVEAGGYVQIYAQPRKIHTPSPSSLLANTKPTKYWQTEDSDIQRIAKDLKSPEEIYRFVVKTLTYNFDRVKPNDGRLGAKGALEDPNNAICMEFTDLFITLARAKGIPAREINGYAFSDNRQIQPLSLVSDVLHSWPEYWDKELGTWVPVDPTWEATSGIDYFNNFDLKHFTFVIHGKSDTLPYSAGSYKLGPNPQKDVYVSLGTLPEVRVSKLEMGYETSSKLNPFKKTFEITVKNNGPLALYDFKPEVYLGNNLLSQEYIKTLLPFSEYSKEVEIAYGIFDSRTPNRLTVLANGEKLTIPLGREQVLLRLIVFALIVLLSSLIGLYLKLKGNLMVDFRKVKKIFTTK